MNIEVKSSRDKIKELKVDNLGLKDEKSSLETKVEKLEKEIKGLEDIKSQYRTTMGLLKDRDDKIADLEKKLENAKIEASEVTDALS